MSCCRNQRLSVTIGMPGWFVVLIADFEDLNFATDVITTGIGRYKDRKSAELEAIEWSKSELIPIEKGAIKWVNKARN